MTNHVHLLVTPRTEFGISHMMQRVGQRYVQTVNRRYRRTGTLWEGRYKASLVQSERYLLTLMRYIELNPVRANSESRSRSKPVDKQHRGDWAGLAVIATSEYIRKNCALTRMALT